MASIFTKIIDRQIPGHFLYEDDVCVVILDRFPNVKGQCLVIPKKEVDYAFDLDTETYNHIFNVAKTMAKALDKALMTFRTCLVVEGFDVAHVHLKLYPLKRKDAPLGGHMHIGDEADDAELTVIATQIIAAFEEESDTEKKSASKK